jgi:hypothetical protein
MAKIQVSSKHLAINKANAQIVGIVAAAAFVSIFCLVASKAVWSQNSYNARVITAKEKAHKQLQKNLKAVGDLTVSYKAFDGTATNVIGGTSGGTGDNDGSNSKITIDALPSTYDFPALTSSLEKIMTDRGLKIGSIAGTDDQINQQGNISSPTPQPVTIPFTFTVSDANYSSVQQLVTALQNSIRPMVIDTLTLTGGASSMSINATAHTYFQPAKNVKISTQVIK